MHQYGTIFIYLFDSALSLRVQDARVEIGRSEVVGLQVGITASSTTSVYIHECVHVHTCTTVAHVHVCTHTCSVTCTCMYVTSCVTTWYKIVHRYFIFIFSCCTHPGTCVHFRNNNWCSPPHIAFFSSSFTVRRGVERAREHVVPSVATTLTPN